ncbi:calcium channel protein [Myotisia sp. PD_48]|nr:calcium channel protein [Myotisia sp. PD_48]
MASARNNNRDANTQPRDPSIPLQDLSRPENTVAGDGTRRARGVGIDGTIPTRQRSRRWTRSSGRGVTGSYERVAGDSPSRHNARDDPSNFESISLSQDAGSSIYDYSAFQQSTIGLSFDPAGPSEPTFSVHSHDLQATEGSGAGSEDSTPMGTSREQENYFTPKDIDTLPLTDSRYLQPISGASVSGSQYSGRHSGGGSQGVRFAETLTIIQDRSQNDITELQGGLSSGNDGTPSWRSSHASSIPSNSALSRASSIVRIMSQRVVNLSSEPQLIEHTLKHKPILKHARMNAPPSLPAMTEYAHDTSAPESPEKRRHRTDQRYWKRNNVNPLRGNSLGMFSPDNPLRKFLCEVLVHPLTEPLILVLIVVQTVLLAIEASVRPEPRTGGWGSQTFDYAFLAIFMIYSLELMIRIIVSGFIINPEEYSTLDRSKGLRNALVSKGRELFMPRRQASTKKGPNAVTPAQVSILRSFTGMQQQADQAGDTKQQQRIRLARRAFFRHSFTRLDFLAVVSYWVSLILSLLDSGSSRYIFLFRMLSSLRILRLLALTSGTTVILRSLKKAAPLLVNVAFFIGFFWLLFAIVGVQSFKSSFRRTCVWVDPEGIRNFTLNQAPDSIQFCGGHFDNITLHHVPWIDSTGGKGALEAKGYICPLGSLCIEGGNPYGGTLSFDNVLQSLELVFVIMSSNTFSDLLYFTTDSDYLVASLFFIAGFVILSLWLVNLLIAVITSSFQVIREESKRSAFTADSIDDVGLKEDHSQRVSKLKRLYDRTYGFWIGIIAFDLVIQGLRSASMSDGQEKMINIVELAVTIVLLVEICLRFGADWRHFHKSRRNWFDLGLAVVTSVIQLPPIRNTERVYAALTIFQVLRIYRIVLAFSVTRTLIMTVFRNIVGLLNLILFVFLVTFLTSILAVQLFRDQMPRLDSQGEVTQISFFNIYNSFLGMYQILSSENWTSILYSATEANTRFNTAWISAAFLIMWFVLANFVVLNMFIAVIQESFDVSEDEKRLHQVRAFLQQRQFGGSSHGNIALSRIFKFGRDTERFRDPLDHGPAALEMLLKDAVVQDFLDERSQLRPTDSQPQVDSSGNPVEKGFLSKIYTNFIQRVAHREPNPFYSKLKISRDYDELDPTQMAKEVLSASDQRKRAQREYLQRYPSYNVSLFIFPPSHMLRRLCQRIVGPGRGNTRFEGVDPYKPVWYIFSAFIYAAIVAMVLLACINTPLYRRAYFTTHTRGIGNWFVWTDICFAVLFTVEAAIKVIADGFFWTPNAYFRGSWGFIDGIVLVTLWVNVIAFLSQSWDVSRVVGAFRALRALRLLNVSDSARETFHAVIIMGGWKVISAAFVSMGFLVPFAIYGLNLFHGRMQRCNDNGFGYNSLLQCTGEYKSAPYAWDMLAPRVVQNPSYSFDNFGESLFILFQIVSQEGWTGVLWDAMSITGVNLQPKPLASQENGLFFVIFNLLGAVFVLTLFVSVFMRNYTEQTGVAFLTAEQRSWLELRKHLRQISPSKRSVYKESQKFQAWCYRVAVKKHGTWAKFITCLLLFHLLLLILEFYPEEQLWKRIRDFIFLTLTLFYIWNLIIRVVGLSWARFRRSSWDLYSVVSVTGTFVTTLLSLIGSENPVFSKLHKLFLVSIALLLIPRNNQLDQLFKTAAASLTSIGNLLATWFILFLVYAIALNQIFGLTKFGDNQTGNINFRTVPKALILLFRMSCGEGWNEIMEDFATMEPPYCTPNIEYNDSDCGSAVWARTLFISWNLISMYIFVSLFVSLIFESFSYVYQRSSGLYAISRDEIRRFKQAWATYDPNGSGYITKESFPRLLGELSGVFEMRIYEGDFTVGSILEDCKVSRRESEQPNSRVVAGIDLNKLAKRLEHLPVADIRKRRARLNSFYEEILVSADPERGISFTSCLMVLAHYNVITDSKSLRLEEFLRRRARLQRVEEAVRRNVVIGFIHTLRCSSRFRRRLESRHESRLVTVPQFSVPEIYVEDEELQSDEDHQTEPSGPRSSRLSASRGTSQTIRPRVTLPRIDTDMFGDVSSRLSSHSRSDRSTISPSSSRQAAGSTSPYGSGRSDALQRDGHNRDGNSVTVQDVMESLDNSIWGESIRRSFTQRRSRGSSTNPSSPQP